jgi:hypothetical protein
MHAMTTPTQLRGPRAAPLGALRAARRGAAPPRPRAAASSSFAPAPKRVVVVGGGWAGFGAAKHLSEQGYDVTLLDAGGAGLTTPTTPGGRPVEPGVKGFWHEYPNIFGLIDVSWSPPRSNLQRKYTSPSPNQPTNQPTARDAPHIARRSSASAAASPSSSPRASGARPA